MEEWDVAPEKIKWRERLKCYWDFDSIYKSFWLTGYILITWRYEKDDIGNRWYSTGEIIDFDIGWYKDGGYG